MEKLFGEIKELTYDLVGYVLPGLIAFVIILIYAINNTTVSLYLIELNIEKYKYLSDFIININIVFLIIISYILGNIVNFISNLIEIIINKFNLNDGNNHDYYGYIQVLKQYVIDNSTEDEILSRLEEEDKNRYLLTKASTNSRFESHNDLIQKYIYKYKFYASLMVIFFILTLDNIASVVFIIIKQAEINTPLYIYIILQIMSWGFIICFICFYTEYKRHKNLREKESYIYLINKINGH
ncbi:MAG: hypothetical protein KH083_07070 [Intestinibacter bartlettii]|uniref:hypothetical protein n=1 Tax=Intestinibacter bartlettii TaxID=261299 RepID=UPI00242F6626|nr:hypothetical protein [Intestinibacter bartlettii]MBS7148156.1 hypothetical protein [Intestinibacter bartlettii]